MKPIEQQSKNDGEIERVTVLVGGLPIATARYDRVYDGETAITQETRHEWRIVVRGRETIRCCVSYDTALRHEDAETFFAPIPQQYVTIVDGLGHSMLMRDRIALSNKWRRVEVTYKFGITGQWANDDIEKSVRTRFSRITTQNVPYSHWQHAKLAMAAGAVEHDGTIHWQQKGTEAIPALFWIAVTPRGTREELLNAIEDNLKENPNLPSAVVIAAGMRASTGAHSREFQPLVGRMLIAWQERVALFGDDAKNPEIRSATELILSQIEHSTRMDTADCRPLVDVKSSFPEIRRITQRLRSQLDLTTQNVGRLRDRLNELQKWCDAHP